MAAPHVIVVGGGIAGLSAAYHLLAGARAQGLPVACTLIEAERRLGGKIITERLDGQLVEGGPDSYLARKPGARRLAARLGLAGDLVGTDPGAQRTYVLHRGSLEPLPEGMMLVAPTRLGPFLHSRLLSPWGKLRLGLDLLMPPSSRQGDQSIADFVGRRLGREALTRLAEPLLAGIYAGDARDLSLLATFPQLKELEQRHGSLLRGLVAMRRSGARLGPGSGPPGAAHPGDSPALPPPASLFETLRGGLGQLVDATAAALGEDVQLRIGQQATALLAGAPGGARYRLQVGDQTLDADAVILAVPAFAAADLLAGLAPGAAAELRRIAYVSVATTVLWYRPEDVGRRLDGSGFVVPKDQGATFTACTWVSSKWPHAARPDRVLVRCYAGRAGDEAAACLEADALLRRVHDELAPLLKLSAPPLGGRVYHWPCSMPQYQVGHRERLQAIENELSTEEIALCGAAYRGIGVPDCIAQGAAAAERVLSRLPERRLARRSEGGGSP